MHECLQRLATGLDQMRFKEIRFFVFNKKQKSDHFRETSQPKQTLMLQCFRDVPKLQCFRDVRECS